MLAKILNRTINICNQQNCIDKNQLQYLTINQHYIQL